MVSVMPLRLVYRLNLMVSKYLTGGKKINHKTQSQTSQKRAREAFTGLCTGKEKKKGHDK